LEQSRTEFFARLGEALAAHEKKHPGRLAESLVPCGHELDRIFGHLKDAHTAHVAGDKKGEAAHLGLAENWTLLYQVCKELKSSL